MYEVLEKIRAVAVLSRPILIVGERGTGKELVAERLHHLSPRWKADLLKINCAAISETLLESELFGHEIGAFTGATRMRRGCFERAHRGTLFLDELGNTAISVQERLLRIIEYGEFERLGGSHVLSVDVRLVAATNEDLPALATSGKFRQDLLDRLAFDVITLPPLRHREDDVFILAEYFGVNMAKELGMVSFPGFAPEARQQLQEHDWPGNIRELKNTVERTLYRFPDSGKPLTQICIDPFASPYRLSKTGLSEQRHARKDTGTNSPEMENPITRFTWPLDFKKCIRDLEVRMLQEAMAEARFNQRRAAELIGLTYHQLRTRLKKHGLS